MISRQHPDMYGRKAPVRYYWPGLWLSGVICSCKPQHWNSIYRVTKVRSKWNLWCILSWCISPETPDQKHITNCFRKHQHSQYRYKTGCDSYRDIEEEWQQYKKPDVSEIFDILSPFPEQPYNNAAKSNKGNVPDDSPQHRTIILKPPVLRQQA